MNVVLLGRDDGEVAAQLFLVFRKADIPIQAVVTELRPGQPLSPGLVYRKMRGRSFEDVVQAALARAAGSRNELGVRSRRSAPALSSLAQTAGTPYHRVLDMNGLEAVDLLRRLGPDLLILAGSPILRRQVLDIPRVGTLNAHMGLLPRYRGMNVTEWSVFNDDPVGVTVHYVNQGVDTGDILACETVDATDCPNINRLRAKVNGCQQQLLARCVRMLMAGQAPPRMPQDLRQGRQYYVMHPAVREMVERKLQHQFLASEPALAHAGFRSPTVTDRSVAGDGGSPLAEVVIPRPAAPTLKRRVARAIAWWTGSARTGDERLKPQQMLALARAISRRLGEPIRVTQEIRSRTGSHTIWMEGRRPLIVKLALHEVAGPRLYENAKGLVALARIVAADASLPRVIPELLLMDRFEEMPYSIETALPGRKAPEFFRTPAALERVNLQGLRFLEELQALSRRDTVLDLETWNRQLQPMISAVGGFANLHDREGVYDRMARQVRDQFLDQRVPLVFAHGNFWIGNLLFDEERGLTGVIDWDSAVYQGLPLVDLLYFLVRSESLSHRTSLGEAFSKWIAADLEPLASHPHVTEYRRAFSIPIAWLRPLFYYCWIQHVHIHVRYRTAALVKTAWLQRNLFNVLAAIRHAEGAGAAVVGTPSTVRVTAS